MSVSEISSIDVYRIRPRPSPDSSPIEPEGGHLPVTPRLKDLFTGPFTGVVGKRTKLQPFHFRFEGDSRSNNTRDLVKDVLLKDNSQHSDACLTLARKLAAVIDNRVGELLLTVRVGRTDREHRCVFWAYPSDSPLQFKVGRGVPDVEEVQNAFSKSSGMRKATFFDAPVPIGRNDLVRGMILDRTANRLKGSSDYWLDGFLEGTIELLPARGTTILIRCLRASQGKAVNSRERASVNAVINRLLSGGHPPTTLREVGSLLVGKVHEAYNKTLPDTVEADATFQIDDTVVSKGIKSIVFLLTNGIQVLLPLDRSLDPDDYVVDRDGVRYLVLDQEIQDESFT